MIACSFPSPLLFSGWSSIITVKNPVRSAQQGVLLKIYLTFFNTFVGHKLFYPVECFQSNLPIYNMSHT